MTKIVGLEDIQSGGHLQQEIAQGGKFVIFQYCISLLVITFKRSSNIYFIPHAENAVIKGLRQVYNTFRSCSMVKQVNYAVQTPLPIV